MAVRSMVALAAALLVFSASASASVYRWGAFGKSGEPQPTPLQVAGLNEEVVKIDSGNASAYALTSTGAVWAWGPNEHGQLGDGTAQASFDEAVRVHFPEGVKIVAIGEERASGFAVDSSGHGWAWGEGTGGSNCLGGEQEDLTEPREIPNFSEVAAVQGGSTHSIWLMQDGTVMMCGENHNGRLGNGTTGGQADTPEQVPGLSNVVEVSSGQGVACARTASGAVFDWGGDEQGQIGNGAFEYAVTSPYQVPLPEAAVELSCGGNLSRNGTTLVVLEHGRIYGWGDDEKGQIGDGQTENKAAPTPASLTVGLGLTQVIASGEYALGVNGEGNVYAWGSNVDHALGTTQTLKMSLTPLLVDTGAVEVSGTAYDSGDRHATIATSSPEVTDLQPNAGLEQGGERVTINGSGFSAVQSVMFGTHEANEVEVVSPTSINVLAPPGSGTVQVTVTTASATSPTGTASEFSYVPVERRPVVKALTPAEGPTAGGTTVTLTGRRFDGVTAVMFGSVPASSYTVISRTSIQAVSPPEPAGKTHVYVTTPNGTSRRGEGNCFFFVEGLSEPLGTGL
jgi:alpha-tubulin suppressor-like RCC1 family protein